MNPDPTPPLPPVLPGFNLNKYIEDNRGKTDSEWLIPRIECADGFSLSVQASRYNYSSPRDNSGPYYQAEVGFPSAKEESLMEYCEDSEDPTGTVYGYVPVSMIEKIIDSHGGIALANGIGVPEGLPPLPSVPEGYDRWEYRGMGYDSSAPCVYAGFFEQYAEDGWIVIPNDPEPLRGNVDAHYIEAVKEPLPAAPSEPEYPKTDETPKKISVDGFRQNLDAMLEEAKPEAADDLPTPHPSGAWDRSDYVRMYEKQSKELSQANAAEGRLRELVEHALKEQMALRPEFRDNWFVEATEDALSGEITPPAPDGWRGMETAPKDKPFIGLMGDGLVFRTKFQLSHTFPTKEEAEEHGWKGFHPTRMKEGWSYEDGDSLSPCNPIGWMPLPKPPIGKGDA